MNKIALLLFRILMVFLVWFELLNWIGILHFSLVYGWFWLIFVAVFADIMVEIIYKNNKIINIPLLLSLVSISVLLDALWDILHLYSIIHNYDKFLHFFNSGVITYLTFIVLKDKLQKTNLGKFFTSVILIAIGSFFWTLYEIEEFLEDVFINHRQIRLWDGYDTAGDLSMNVLWCIIMTLILLLIIKNNNDNKQ